MPPVLYDLKKVIALVFIIICVLAVTLWHRDLHKVHSMQVFIMDTIVELQAVGSNTSAQHSIKNAVEEIKRIDASFGYQSSLVDELNTSHRIQNRELYELINFSLGVNQDSLGAFSITLRPILDAWGFSGSQQFQLPASKDFEQWRMLPGEKGIFLHEDAITVLTAGGVKIDLGGVAKGYAADRAALVMKESGIKTGLANAGGDITAFGDRTWNIGIKHPRDAGVFATIPIKNRSVATSGDYERFFLHNGRRYCHILDPSTGWPADRYISSTITADSCVQADAWATAVFVKGIEALEGPLREMAMEWIVVDRAGNVIASEALRGYCPNSIAIE